MASVETEDQCVKMPFTVLPLCVYFKSHCSDAAWEMLSNEVMRFQNVEFGCNSPENNCLFILVIRYESLNKQRVMKMG